MKLRACCGRRGPSSPDSPPWKRARLLALSVATGAPIAQPVDRGAMSAALEATPINTFRYIGNQLVCKAQTADLSKCLRIGRVKVGEPYEAVRNGQAPWKEVTLPDGVIASVFPIVARDDANAYWVIGHSNDRVVSIQFTGNFAHPGLAFSTIQIDDPEHKVREILGPRYSVRSVAEVDGTQWDYAPSPISMEIVKGKVYSIRVERSGHPPQPPPKEAADGRPR